MSKSPKKKQKVSNAASRNVKQIEEAAAASASEALAASQPGPLSEEQIQNIIRSYDVDPYDYTDEQLVDFSVVMFREHQFFKKFKFTESSARTFFNQVRKFYNPENLFHNFKHVWSVMHICYQIIGKGRATQYLEIEDIFAVMMAALCHDLHHPGNNNAFELATESELSKMYSFPDEVCILEHHHAQSAHKLLLSDEQDIIKGLTKVQRERFFDQMEFIILGTDMAKHSNLVEEVLSYMGKIDDDCSSKATTPSSSQRSLRSSSKSEKASTPLPNGKLTKSTEKNRKNGNLKMSISSSNLAASHWKRQADKNDPDFRTALTRVIVHAADLGAQTQSTPVAYSWMKRCYGEYRSQANKERTLGIMTSPFLHDLQEDYKTYASQHSFIAGTVEPLWKALSDFLPGLKFAYDQLLRNNENYQRMLDEYYAQQKVMAEETKKNAGNSKKIVKAKK